uniref:myotrophin-like n=1 Tax=Ciona intestinalis TaxID=7719 RepID=UPI00006A3ACB|nr:myotrophin-like [Ciona intestinalis]|eukprot:XP_018670263.1 myotrophin-like [Ciona intestinalis]
MSSGQEDVSWSIRNGDLEMLKTHAAKPDFNVNMETNQSTLLVTAADYGQSIIIEFLISKGANVNGAGKNGITPLLAAIWEGHSDAVRLLLKHGADKNLKSPGGNSYADEAPNDDIKRLL